MVVEAKMIRRKKLREYVRSLEWKRVKRDGYDNVEHMWEQVKRAMVKSAREVCGSMRVGGKPQRVCGGTMRQVKL